MSDTPPTTRPRRRRLVRTVARSVRRIADLVPPTPRGWLVACLAAAAFWFLGLGALDLVLYVVGVCGLAVVALASLAVVVATLVLRRRLRRAADEPCHLEAGAPVRTGFAVPALSRVPWVDVHWQWREPAAVEVRRRPRDGQLLEEVVVERRCQLPGIERRIVVGDVFGLARLAWQHRAASPLTVLPAVGRLRTVSVVQSLASGDALPHPAGAPEGDRMEIRPYVPGDSMRHILWKTFARTRELNVRLPERSVERARRTVAYLVTDPADEPAAAAARVALESGALGPRWLFGADGVAEPADSLPAALDAIARSGSLGGNGHRAVPGLGAFFERIVAAGESHCIVFAPARRGRWTGEVLRLARSHPGALSFVLATDGVERARHVPLWRRLLFAPEPRRGTAAEELGRTLRTLGDVGCPAVVVDRSTGRSYGPGHRRALEGAP